MHPQSIIARKHEIKVLERLISSPKAEFLAVYGRRRVGKTFLIQCFFKNRGTYFSITGSKNASKRDQLHNFHREFRALFPEHPPTPPKDWGEALDRLKTQIEQIDKQQKIILFFDELPWLATPKSGFTAALDYFWNRHASWMNNVVLIICGSAAAWMIQKVIYNKGGLYGRLSGEMRLQPFTLSETEEFLSSKGILLKRKQLVELYMAMGGVAKYLTFVRKGLSPAQIINELCFNATGPLLTEFQKLYQSLFDSPEKHIAIVRLLAKKRFGLTQKELLEQAKLSPGGWTTSLFQELEESGFIMSIPKFGSKKKDQQFRLIDEYSYFYLKWIEQIQATLIKGADDQYWVKKCSSQEWLSWAGYAFENICFKQLKNIKKHLGLSAVSSQESYWLYKPSSKGESGAQIDLIIDRADHCINLCEIKYYNTEYTMTKEHAEELERKKFLFQEKTKTKKTLLTTLITSYGVKESEHSIGVVDSQLTMDALFD